MEDGQVLDSISSDKRRGYSAEAPVYDRRWETSWGRFYDYYEQRLVTRFVTETLTDPARILDVPAGTGRLTGPLQEAFPQHQVTACDLTANMLAVARKRPGAERATFVLGKAQQLPFPDDTFDLVLSIRFLHLIPVKLHHWYVDEMLRVLKPGGRLLLEFYNPFEGVILGALFDIRRFIVDKKPPTGYLWPHQLKRLNSGRASISHKFGVSFPLLGRLFRRYPKAALQIARLGNVFPFYFLTSYLVVAVQKR